MATITETVGTGLGAVALTLTTLTGTADTFTYRQGTGQILMLRNPSGSPISPVIDGAGGSTAAVPGLGNVSVASGFAVGSIAAGAAVAIPLDTIFQYLKGAIAITSGADLVASLLRTK
jgi:hypothetical protein